MFEWPKGAFNRPKGHSNIAYKTSKWCLWNIQTSNEFFVFNMLIIFLGLFS